MVNTTEVQLDLVEEIEKMELTAGENYQLLRECKNDKERWQFLKDYTGSDLTVYLDTNMTYIFSSVFEESVDFDWCIGNMDGRGFLLDLLNIKYEVV